jgi:hypothetical protein
LTYFGFNRLYPEGTPTTSATQRRCPTCRTWYPARAALCPDCKTMRHAFNKSMRVAMLNTNTNKQREAAIRDR